MIVAVLAIALFGFSVVNVSLLWVVISRMRHIARAHSDGQDMEQLRSLALATIGVGLQNSVEHVTASSPSAGGRAPEGYHKHRNGNAQETPAVTSSAATAVFRTLLFALVYTRALPVCSFPPPLSEP